MDENKNKDELEKVEKNESATITNDDNNIMSSFDSIENIETSYESPKISTNYNPSTSSSEQQNSNNTQKKKKSSVKLAIIIVLIVSLLIGAITAIYFLLFSTETIDLSKHITVTYSGFDGSGTATTVEFSNSLKDEFEDSSIYKKFKKKAELEITSDNYGTLKNGDKIKVKVSISNSWLKENKLELKDKKIEVKVAGLPEPEEIDVFEDIEITVKGISPNLSVSIETNSENEFISDYVYFSADEYYDLSNGDTVTITASYSDYDAEEMGVIVKDDTMEYTIKDAAAYILKKDEFTDNVLSTLNTGMINEIKENIDYAKYDIYYNYSDQYNPTSSYTSDLVAGEPELVNLYLLTSKDTDSYYYSNNYVYGIYKTTYTSTETGAKFDWYFCAYVSDVATEGGKIYEDDFGYYYYCYDGESVNALYEEYISDEAADYNIINIK